MIAAAAPYLRGGPFDGERAWFKPPETYGEILLPVVEPQKLNCDWLKQPQSCFRLVTYDYCEGDWVFPEPYYRYVRG